MSIDEVALSNGELYTVITNKEKKGRKGCLAAIIKGTKAEIVNTALEKVPVGIRFAVEEITLDLANTMDWICRTSFPFAMRTADRFHFQKIVTEGVQEIRIKLRRESIDEYNLEVAEAKKSLQTEFDADFKDKRIKLEKEYNNLMNQCKDELVNKKITTAFAIVFGIIILAFNAYLLYSFLVN